VYTFDIESSEKRKGGTGKEQKRIIQFCFGGFFFSFDLRVEFFEKKGKESVLILVESWFNQNGAET
jgi:hypothetical protein